jgi:hypothetical protein
VLLSSALCLLALLPVAPLLASPVVSLPVQPQRILAEQNKAHSAQDVKTETNKEYGYGTVLLMSCFADDVGANSEICLYLVEI